MNRKMNAAYAVDPVATVEAALSHLSPDCDRKTWVVIGMAVKDALDDAGLAVWDAWSQGGHNYNSKDTISAWRSFKPTGKTTAGTLFHLAQLAGWQPQAGIIAALPKPTLAPETLAAHIAQTQAAQEAAAQKARGILQHAPLVLNHAYLSAKRIQSHGGYLAFGKLAIPLYSGLTCPPQGRYADIAHLVNVQLIDQAGVKRFLKGGKKAGCFWWIGPTSETVCIAEGFATAASIYEATGNRCFIAFDAGNLPAVAKAVRKLYPHTPLIICADHDTHGIGQHYAEQAALEIGAAVAMPETPGADFNDVWRGCNG